MMANPGDKAGDEAGDKVGDKAGDTLKECGEHKEPVSRDIDPPETFASTIAARIWAIKKYRSKDFLEWNSDYEWVGIIDVIHVVGKTVVNMGYSARERYEREEDIRQLGQISIPIHDQATFERFWRKAYAIGNDGYSGELVGVMVDHFCRHIFPETDVRDFSLDFATDEFPELN